MLVGKKGVSVGRRRIELLPSAADALAVLGQQVRVARLEQRWTVEELGARAGVSARTVSLIEHGEPSVSAGHSFNVATVVGVNLFARNNGELARLRAEGGKRVALLPARVYNGKQVSNDVDSDAGADEPLRRMVPGRPLSDLPPRLPPGTKRTRSEQ
jgi:transcriptional regulator with XRE-family HTH domain